MLVDGCLYYSLVGIPSGYVDDLPVQISVSRCITYFAEALFDQIGDGRLVVAENVCLARGSEAVEGAGNEDPNDLRIESLCQRDAVVNHFFRKPTSVGSNQDTLEHGDLYSLPYDENLASGDAPVLGGW